MSETDIGEWNWMWCFGFVSPKFVWLKDATSKTQDPPLMKIPGGSRCAGMTAFYHHCHHRHHCPDDHNPPSHQKQKDTVIICSSKSCDSLSLSWFLQLFVIIIILVKTGGQPLPLKKSQERQPRSLTFQASSQQNKDILKENGMQSNYLLAHRS